MDCIFRRFKKFSESSNDHRFEIAFHKIYRVAGVYKDPQLKPHALLTKILSSSLIFEANKMPMIVPPMPWYLTTQGGYFLSKSNLLRLSDSMQEQRILIDQSNGSSVHTVYDSLNSLSLCPWRVNTKILDLLIKVFNDGGNKDLDVPEPEWKGPQIPKFPR